jgi:CheY-like chemotaxis protein
VTHKLLLADDSVTIQRVIELTFADEDVQVLAVGDGQQAIDRIRTDRPDIVLADVGMPERDGYEVAAFVKNDPQLAHIPVLLLTGAFEPVDEVRARAVGCDGVLVKPFEPQMVISRVRDLLSGGGRDAFATGGSADEPKAAAAAPEPPAAGGSLEDYFDRLDAALATKVGSPPPPEPVLAPAPGVKPAPDQPRRITPAEAAAIPHVFSQGGPVPEPPPRVTSAAPPPAAIERPAPRPEPVRPAAPPRRDDAVQETSLQEAFAALLAAEQAQAAAPPPAPVSAPPSDALIEEVARRVIARMGDESMRAAVLDVAERLVREEIARIKGQN